MTTFTWTEGFETYLKNKGYNRNGINEMHYRFINNRLDELDLMDINAYQREHTQAIPYYLPLDLDIDR